MWIRMSYALRVLVCNLFTCLCVFCLFFFSSRRRHTRCLSDWSSDVCSEALLEEPEIATVGGEVIVVDVGDDRDQRLKVREGGVALVGLGHEVTPGAEPRVARAALQASADHVGRILAALGEDAGDQARGGGLAVRA